MSQAGSRPELLAVLGLCELALARRATHKSQNRPDDFQGSLLGVHGWDRIKNVHFYSLLGLSIHKNCEMLPNYDKLYPDHREDPQSRSPNLGPYTTKGTL